MVESYEAGPLRDALLFSLNYALCFILVTQTGGIIATKQPAMTASRIASHIDKDDDLELDSMRVVVVLIRKVFGSQFISIVGNFLMALVFACITFGLLSLGGLQNFLKVDSGNLIRDVLPSGSLIGFSAAAGIFLALAGIISGYVDNKIIASKIPHRIANNPLFLNSKVLANFTLKRGGAIIGNLILGFFLGSAFLLSYIFPFSVDIRHIAFSSSYLGYAIMSQPLDALTIIKALLGIMMIGFTNLIVSFSIILLLALKSRGAKLSLIPRLFIHSLKDFLTRPLDYLIVRDRQMENNGKD
jgi:site-specific recombinase